MIRSITSLFLMLVISSVFYACSNSSNPAGGSSTTYSITNNYRRLINKSIPATDTLLIADAGSVNYLHFDLDTVFNIDGTLKLDVVLVHNNIVDTIIKQFRNISIPSYNFSGVSFSDSSELNLIPGLLSYSGSYKPYNSLSVFNGQPLSGPWYLVFSYPTVNKTGVIKSWSITVTYNANTPQAIIPLEVGNKWIFYTSNSTYETLEIVGTSSINGKSVYNWKWDFWTSRIAYYRLENDGAWNYGFNDFSTSPNLHFKFPINLSESYITHYLAANTDTITCEALDETYNGYSGCIKYHDRNDDTSSVFASLFPDRDNISSAKNENILYIKPGVGIIGQEFYKNGVLTGYRRLYSYTLH